jgi:hypothetical protein
VVGASVVGASVTGFSAGTVDIFDDFFPRDDGIGVEL